DAGLVQVSPGAGAVDLTGPAAGYPDSPDRYRPSGSVNFARTVPADNVVVEAAASWAAEIGATQAAVTSDGSPFENLAASEFKSAAAGHGVQVKTPALIKATAPGDVGFVYGPEGGTLAGYGKAPRSLAVSAELDPSRLQDKGFAGRFEQRFHRVPGPYA